MFLKLNRQGRQSASNPVQASSVGFDAPAKGVTFSPVGGDGAGGGKTGGLDLSSITQQRRASVELGMGGLSHKSLMSGGAGNILSCSS